MPLTRSQRQKAVEGEKDVEVIEKEDVSAPEKKVSLQSGSESADDGSSSSDTSGSSSSESESSEEEEDLDALFEKSLVALREQDRARTTTSFADNEDEIRLEGGDQELSKTTKKGTAPKQTKKKSRTGLAPKQVESAFQRLERGDELGDDRPKTYRQKQRDGREERSKSIGSKWFGMPAFAGANTGKKNDENDQKSLINPKGKDGDGRGRSAEEMRREVQAIRLRNAVDPKRFYRGSAKGEMEMPKYAQLGKIISGNADAASTMTRDQRGKSVIDELVKDAESSAYAKRKFNEQQAKTNVGWSSHVRRHQKKKGGVSNKRQRR